MSSHSPFTRKGSSAAAATSVAAAAFPADVVLRPLIVVRGTVVDDQTGAPIDAFIAHAEVRFGKMSGGRETPGVHGKYEVQLDEPGELYSVRVCAEGYLPAQSPRVPAGTGPLEFNLRLRKGQPVTGLLLQPDGAPCHRSGCGAERDHGDPGQ